MPTIRPKEKKEERKKKIGIEISSSIERETEKQSPKVCDELINAH